MKWLATCPRTASAAAPRGKKKPSALRHCRSWAASAAVSARATSRFLGRGVHPHSSDRFPATNREARMSPMGRWTKPLSR